MNVFESYQSVQNTFYTFRGAGEWRGRRYLKEWCPDFACSALLGRVFDHKSGTSTSKLHILVHNFAFMPLKSDSKSDRPLYCTHPNYRSYFLIQSGACGGWGGGPLASKTYALERASDATHYARALRLKAEFYGLLMKRILVWYFVHSSSRDMFLLHRFSILSFIWGAVLAWLHQTRDLTGHREFSRGVANSRSPNCL